MTDYLNKNDLLALGLDEANADRLLCDTALAGHDAQPVVEAERLQELLDMLRREWRNS